MDSYQAGDLFHRSFRTPEGEIEMLAEVVIEGTTIHLKDIAIYPVTSARLEIGLREALAIRDALAEEMMQQGFERLRISGTRYSGASPGKHVAVLIDMRR